jgi:hypothetical protein
MTRSSGKTAVIAWTVIAFALMMRPVLAQQKRPDLNGVWQGPYTPDLSRTLQRGETIPFTPYGDERFKNVDPADNPDGFCLPVGPARGFQSPAPFQIVQNDNTIAVLFENQRIYRIIYTDGTKHPEDIADYPEWMGHSIGRWEGAKLVVDTVGINERTWLDTAGHEHSGKLRLTETFEKTGADNIHYTVTFDDPIFFAKAWTSTRDFKRQSTRIMSYSCEENEKDQIHLQRKNK